MTKEQLGGALNVVMAVADAIKELKRVPSGELYARVMAYVDLATYDKIIGILKNAGLIAEVNHELSWKASGGRWD